MRCYTILDYARVYCVIFDHTMLWYVILYRLYHHGLGHHYSMMLQNGRIFRSLHASVIMSYEHGVVISLSLPLLFRAIDCALRARVCHARARQLFRRCSRRSRRRLAPPSAAGESGGRRRCRDSRRRAAEARLPPGTAENDCPARARYTPRASPVTIPGSSGWML